MVQQHGVARHFTLADAPWSPATGSDAARAIALVLIGTVLLTVSAKIQSTAILPFAWRLPHRS